MKNNKIKPSGTILSVLIIILSFVYAINIQPKAIGDSENLKDISIIKTGNQGSQNSLVNNHESVFEDEIHNNNYTLYLDLSFKNVTLSFYIKNIFYTITNFIDKINNLRNLSEILQKN